MDVQIPMFEQQADEVTTMYFDGMLQVVVNRQLTKQQIKNFTHMNCNVTGIKSIELDTCAPFGSENTCFIIAFLPKYSNRTEEVRANVRKWAERFLVEMQPDSVQTSLF
jgi:hypothetical protein